MEQNTSRIIRDTRNRRTTRSTNPFSDDSSSDEEQYTNDVQREEKLEQRNKLLHLQKLPKSTNPFDSSSTDDRGDDDDSSSSLYEDCCEPDSYHNHSATKEALGDNVSSKFSNNKLLKLDTSSSVQFINQQQKRTANLNFDIQATDERPSLRFDMNSQTPTNKFVSPLEAALFEKSDDDDHDSHEDISIEDDEENDSDSDGDDGENNNYHSLLHSLSPKFAWFSRIIKSKSGEQINSRDDIGNESDQYHQKKQLRNDCESLVSEDFLSTISKSDYHSTSHHLFSSSSSSSLEEDFRLAHKQENTNPIMESNPLLESEQVRKRFDLLTDSISHITTNRQSSTKINMGRKKKEKKERKWFQRRHSKHNKTNKNISTTITKNLSSSIRHSVLSKIVIHPKEHDLTIDHVSRGTPWAKMILLEELGTASSWIVLLIPYISLALALFLDSGTSSSWWNVVTTPLNSYSICDSDRGTMMEAKAPYIFPLTPSPIVSCSYPYIIQEGSGILSTTERINDIVDHDYLQLMSKGMAITSGPISEVPVMSSTLYGDIKFKSLSDAQVTFVSQGSVYFSTIVLQLPLHQDPTKANNWIPLYISPPTQLAMICEMENPKESVNESNHDNNAESKEWSCTCPRGVDVIFSLPDTSVMTGGVIRIETLLSHHDPNQSLVQNIEIVNKNNVQKAISHITDPEHLIEEISTSASYIITHRRSSYTDFSIFVRITTLMFTFCSLIFWSWTMGIDGFFGFNNCGNKRQIHDVSWWESPWILFPERRYLFLLFFALLLIQNPLLAYVYYHPELYSSPLIHIIVDSMIGIGTHGVLVLFLCLFHGLRYHTAKLERKRAIHRKQTLELRRATKYLADEGHPHYNTDRNDNLSSYYEQYGDIDGGGSSTLLDFHMKHDPCGQSWADFLLFKIFLFILATFMVIITSIYRFSGSMTSDDGNSPLIFNKWFSVNQDDLFEIRKIYYISSFVQGCILVIWIILIIRAAFTTGNRLKKEPFLSTRPAQLAFRVLCNILVLGVAAVFIPFMNDMLSLKSQWNNANSSFDNHKNDKESTVYSTFQKYMTGTDTYTGIELILRSLTTQRFPYNITAVFLLPGKLIYITTCALTVAFIFLPSSSIFGYDYVDSESGDASLNKIKESRQRLDKRIVVTMAKYTQSWRVFPLPIKKERDESIPNTKPFKVPDSFQILKNLNLHSSKFGRGMVYSGNYMPVFCVELALWLLECSWQSYYSATEFMTDDFAPGRMNLSSIGLNLEKEIIDDVHDIRAYISSNLSAQIDGEEDSIIVVSFRGTASSTNLKTDFNWGQVPLPDYFSGIGENSRPLYQINVQIGNAKKTGKQKSKFNKRENDLEVQVSKIKNEEIEDEDIPFLKTSPLTRQAFPCVHTGFLEVYSIVRDQIIEGVCDVLLRQLHKSMSRDLDIDSPLVLPKLYICGHSLGGALGQLLALDIASNIEIVLTSSRLQNSDIFKKCEPENKSNSKSYGSIEKKETYDRITTNFESSPELFQRCRSDPSTYERANSLNSTNFVHNVLSGMKFMYSSDTYRLRPPIAVYTFGQPRVGNRAFAILYKKNVPHTFRVVNEEDVITSWPLATFFRGVGFYKHAGLDVILDEGGTGNILVGPTIVETLFRFSKVRTNFNAHLMENYRDGLQSALTQDELQEFYLRHHGSLKKSLSDIAAGTNANSQRNNLGTSSSILQSVYYSQPSHIPAWVTQSKVV